MIPLLLIVVLSLAGCYSQGSTNIKNQELIDQVKLGKSTTDDVRRLFGEPNGVTRSSSQVANPADSTKMITLVEWWSYIHASSQTDAKSFIPVVGAFIDSSTYETNQFMVGYDIKGVVQHITTGAQQGKVGMY
jgi:outer membrane protein assembly factor BamE (lipoprotein component of BamABCDE complex)